MVRIFYAVIDLTLIQIYSRACQYVIYAEVKFILMVGYAFSHSSVYKGIV